MRVPAPLFIPVALLVLGGCQAQAPTPPTAPLSAAETSLGVLPDGVDHQPLPDRWWSLYRDPQLDQLVERALQHNQDLAQTDAHLKALMAGVRQQQAALWPSTEVQAGVPYGRSSDDQVLAEARDGHAANHWETALGFDLAWQLDLYGQLRAAIAAAQASVEAQTAARDQLRLGIAAQTSQAYIDLCSFTARQAVLQQSLDNLDSSLRLTERQHQGGVATALDSRRLQVLASRTRAELPWLQARQQMAAFSLAQLTGQANAPAEPCQQLPNLNAALPSGEAWHLLQRRPDIRQAERQWLAAHWRAEQVRGDLYPQVSLGATLNTASQHLDGLGDSRALSFGVGPLIRWRFPNRAANRARLAAADAEREASLAAWRSSVLSALKDVRSALARYAGERQRAQTLDQAAQQSREAFELAERGYRAGSLDGLQQLDAQRELIAAQAQQVEARQRQAHSEIALFQALGGGWQAPDSLTLKEHP